jgi:GTPase SAR1 family protein
MCSGSMSAEEKARMEHSRKLDEENRKAYEDEAAKVKLLLLGAGESGKSTLFRQMEILYGKGFSEDDRRQQFTSVVYLNTILAMKALCTAVDTLDDGALKAQLAATAEFDALQALDDHAEIDDTNGKLVQTLWADPAIQAAWVRRAEFQIVETNKKFFDDIERIMDFDYVPSEEDILHTRVRTSGIIKKEYNIDDVNFQMFDVGGQRNERKKWIHCFDDVHAVIFVAAISEYDQVCFEDSSTNRMHEALTLFNDVANSKWFTDTSIILFLNKRDLFEEKIKSVKIKSLPEFDDYEGEENDYEDGIKYFLKKFLDQLDTQKHHGENKEIYHHVTCATDKDNVRKIFNASKEIILKNNLQSSGFM